MRLVSFDGGRIGVVSNERVIDVSGIVGAAPGEWPTTAMVRTIAGFDRFKAQIADAAKKGGGVPIAQAKLETPIAWPNKLLAYPINYVDHGAEMKSAERANLNGFFMKANSSLSGPNDPIVLPDVPTREIHHECELALIIGKRCRHVPRAQALDCIFGYSCLIDVSVRGKEERVMRKSYDTFCPVGPWIATADEVGDPSALDLKLWVNGALKQNANTRDLLVDVPEMIALASSVATLEPGDIIASGTPAGVGPIKHGDSVRIWIEKVGEMTVSVVQGKGGYNLAIPREAKG